MPTDLTFKHTIHVFVDQLVGIVGFKLVHIWRKTIIRFVPGYNGKKSLFQGKMYKERGEREIQIEEREIERG